MNALDIIIILILCAIVMRIDLRIQRRAARKWCIEHDIVPEDTEVDERTSIIKRLLCKHEYVFERNIYGDETNHVGGNRSWWRCKKCGKRKLDPHLYIDGKEFPSCIRVTKTTDTMMHGATNIPIEEGKDARVENEKLRELIRDVWHLFTEHGAVHPCDLPAVDAVRDRMRELRVEVDE